MEDYSLSLLFVPSTNNNKQESNKPSRISLWVNTLHFPPISIPTYVIAKYAGDVSMHTLTSFLLLLPIVHHVVWVSEWVSVSWACLYVPLLIQKSILFSCLICSLIILNAIVRRNKECTQIIAENTYHCWLLSDDDEEDFLSEQITTITYCIFITWITFWDIKWMVKIECCLTLIPTTLEHSFLQPHDVSFVFVLVLLPFYS